MDTNENAIVEIRQKITYLNKALAKVGQFILDHPETSKTITIKDLARKCEVAESSITRFVREVGYQNFQDFKIALAEALLQIPEQDTSQMYIYEDITEHDSTSEIAEKVYYRSTQILALSKQMINSKMIDRAVEMIERANILIFSCIGSSSLAAEEGVMRFARAGKKCVFFRDASQQLITASASNKGDLLIGISNSGKTVSVVNAMEIARSRGVPTIGITAFAKSPLDLNSDITLFTPTKQSDSGNGFGWESTSSKTAQIMLMDILYACYAARHYADTREQLEKSYKAIRHTRI